MSLSGGGQAGGFRAAKEFVGGIRRMRLPETAQEGESDGKVHVEGDWVVQLTHVVCDFRANAEGRKGDDPEELHTHTASRGTRASVRDACRNFTQFLRSATRVPGCAPGSRVCLLCSRGAGGASHEETTTAPQCDVGEHDRPHHSASISHRASGGAHKRRAVRCCLPL